MAGIHEISFLLPTIIIWTEVPITGAIEVLLSYLFVVKSRLP
jgi:hypothetical protein